MIVVVVVAVIVAVLVVGWFVRLVMKKNLRNHSHIMEADSTRSNSKLRREEAKAAMDRVLIARKQLSITSA